MDLFEFTRKGILEKDAPLASRMRPRTLEEVVGQEHIIGDDKLLSRAIRADRIGSLIFYGPPGTGKTTLAQVIANTTHARFVQINATTAGKKDMEDAVQKARDSLGMEEKRADVIAGGAVLLAGIMETLKIEEITFSESDNLEGYLRYRGLI